MCAGSQNLPEVAIHTKFSREIRPIQDWPEWIEEWQATASLDGMLGLIHRGFELPGWDSRNPTKDYLHRIIFYFGIADGWANEYSLETKDERGHQPMYAYKVDPQCHNLLYLSESQARQKLAKMAFDQLALNFFKRELRGGGRNGDDFNESWISLVASERLFPVIQNFFRAGKKDFLAPSAIRNLNREGNRTHTEKLAVDFLINLATLIWGWEMENSGVWCDDAYKARIADICSRLNASKPWMVEVLAGIDRLDVLQPHIVDLDKQCLAKLKEIALRTELSTHRYPVFETRTATSVEEACLAGSKAAWFLVKHGLIVTETKRLNAILDAERKKKAAEERLSRLVGKK